MKILQKRIIIIGIICSLTTITSGCWNARELNTLSIVMGIGIDQSENSDNIDMTTQIVNSKSSSETSGSSSSQALNFINLEDSGKNVFSILRNYTHGISRKLYLSHNQVIIFGEQLAKSGIRDSMDFFLRDAEPRLNVNVLVSVGDAKDIFKVNPVFSNLPSADISELIDIQHNTSENAILTAKDLMMDFSIKTKSTVAPIISIQEDKEEVNSSEGKDEKKDSGTDSKYLLIEGGAVFKEDKMIGTLDKKQSRGLSWVTNNIKHGVIDITCLGQDAVIEILKSKSTVKVDVDENDSINAYIYIDVSTNLGSQKGSINLATPENLDRLNQSTQDAIKAEIQQAIDKSMELNADIFDFGSAIHRKYPSKWTYMEDDWDNLFRTIQCHIEIFPKNSVVGGITRPNYPSKED